ncbi:putative multidrug resistance protein NorM [Flavobacterium longum]|uniref:MATE family efflux transporter n=1 Tax=Flavobacterium longum TaxID=1299340 RepID=UPI0039EB562D
MNFSRYTKEFSYNLQLAYPVILGMLGHTAIGVVDNIMVGKLGTTELAAVSLGNTMVFIAMSLGIGFSTAITPIVGEADAENDQKKIRSAFHHGLILCTVLGVGLFMLVTLAKPILGMLHQPKDVIDLALPYLDWVAFSLVPLIIYQGYKQFADGLSHTKYSMYAIIGSNIIHVGLNYVLIYGIWIFPEMGIQGAALGTVISRIAMVVFMHFILRRNNDLRPHFNDFSFKKISKQKLQKIIDLGTPSALQMFFEVTLFTTAVWLCGNIGKSSQAANQIALSLATVTFMFAMGLSVTAMIRISNQKGMNDYKQLIVVARSIFLLAIIVEVIFAFLFVALHQVLPAMFLDMDDPAKFLTNAEAVSIAADLLIIAAIFQISDGIQVVVLGALRGLQDVKIPMYITFVAYWVIGFPISYVLGEYTSLKAVGVWMGLLAGLTAAALFLYLRFDKITKRLVRENPQPAEQTSIQ